MKRFNSILAGLVAAVGLLALSSTVQAAAASHDTKATVRSVTGEASYSINGGSSWMPLHPNTELDPSAVLKTGADGQVDLQVNGRTSTVRIVANTTMTLTKMEAAGMMGGDTETQLDIANGQVLGSVKKISGDSTYHIGTPRGVAGIRGTDFSVQVTQQANGSFTVTFTSVTGQVIVVANIRIAGVPTSVTKTLGTGQSWTPVDAAATLAAVNDIVQVAPELLAALMHNIPTTITLPSSTGPPVTIKYIPPTTNPTETGGKDSNSNNSSSSSNNNTD